jgi:NAD-dependent dihydropyrimidine dehydrogenase PreA subunit
MADDKKFTEWHGVPRERIKWNPSVDYEKCVGCGMCATGCGRGVYSWDFKKDRPVVANPDNCLVGCVTCSNTCLQGAVSFPGKGVVREAILKNNVLASAKAEVKAKFGKADAQKDKAKEAGCACFG